MHRKGRGSRELRPEHRPPLLDRRTPPPRGHSPAGAAPTSKRAEFSWGACLRASRSIILARQKPRPRIRVLIFPPEATCQNSCDSRCVQVSITSCHARPTHPFSLDEALVVVVYFWM